MGIDITKLNGKLQDVAENIDSTMGNNNKVLDGNELTIFDLAAKNLVDKGEVKEEDVSEIFGMVKSEGKVENKTTTAPTKLSKKDTKRYQNAVKNSVEKYVKAGVQPDELMAALQKEFSNPEYAPMLQDVQAILDAVNATKYDSKEDVEKIKKTVKEDLDISKRDWQYDVLKDLIDQAEETQINKEFKALVEMYNDVKKTMAGTDIVKNQGDNYKAYAEIVKDELQKKGPDGKKAWDESYTKEAYAKLEDYIKDDAKEVVMSQITETTATKKRKWVKEMKAKNTADDDFQTEARKDADTERKVSLRHNKVEKTAKELENISKDDIISELTTFGRNLGVKKAARRIFEKLNRSYLAENKNADGSYNLRGLSEAIQTRIGKDYLVNKSDDTEMSEMRNIQAELKAITGQDFSDKETKMILHMLGIKRENNADALVKSLLKNVIPSALSAAAAGYVAKGGHQDVTQTVNITMDSTEAAQGVLNELAKQGISPTVVELSGGRVAIRIFQEVLTDDRVLNALTGAGIGAIQGALMALIFGDGKTFEKSCVSIADFDFSNPRYTDFSQYEEYVKGRYPEAKAEAIIALAKTFKGEDGKFSAEMFDSAMKHIAGVGSNLNCDEMKGAKLYGVPEIKTPEKEPEKPVVTEGPQGQDEGCEETPCKLDKTTGHVDTTLPHEVKFGDSWEEIVKAYFPTWKDCYGKMYGKGGAIQALKQALATKADGTLDNQMYQKLLAGHIPSVINIPETLGDCKRNDEGKVAFRKPEGDPKGYMGQVGIKTGYGTVTLTDCTNASATGKNVQEALDKLNKAQGTNYTKEDIVE